MNLRIGRFAPLLISVVGFIPQVHATNTLLGAGKTVQALFYNGVFAGPEGELTDPMGTSDPTSLASPVFYIQGAADFSTILVGDTKITITNLAADHAPFCFSNNSGTACPDVIQGFDFKFTGENITSVTVDGLSAADFLPVSGTFQGNTHLGLQIISPNEIRVDVTGDAPLHNDQLILDIGPFTPEPSSTLIFVLLGAGVLTWRRLSSLLRRESSRRFRN